MNAYSVLRKAFCSKCPNKQDPIPVETHPFPHIVIENALPFWLYDHLAKTRPEVPHSGGSNKRYDLSAAAFTGTPNQDEMWQKFIDFHCSEHFYRQVADLFSLSYQGSVGMRKRDNADIRMDCQVSINTPCTERSQVCIAHVDNPETKFAGLLYMPDRDDDAGGDLEIYDCPEPEFFGKRRVANPGKPVKIVPYKPNVFVGFVNSPTSVHAPQARNVTDKTRKFVNMVVDY